ncbi:MAG: D-2-hydroxyacid dehydrogenase [Clostridia bacterium]
MKILVTPPVTAEHKAILESIAGTEYIYCDADKVSAKLMENIEVVFGNIGFDLIKAAQDLKLLQLFTAGTDGYVDILPKGCELTNTTGAFGLAISEHMLGMMLMLMKRMHQYRDNQLKCSWQDMGNVNSVAGSVVLTIGLGDIGGEFARKAKALGAYTIGVRRKDTRKPEYIDELYLVENLDKLIPRADVIALAMPGNGETRHVINKMRIDSMKQGAIVLNVGRGNAIDTQALTDAVQRGQILAGLDVTDPEPLPKDHPLWKCENALITPHVSGFFHLKKTLDNMVDIAALNITAIMAGKPLHNVIDRETGYRKLER